MRQLILSAADRWYGFTPSALLPTLEESQFWPRERLDQLQVENLRKLLVHAGKHVPFYRDLFRTKKFDPANLQSVEEIECLPVLGKPEIMAQVDDFVSETAQKPLVWLQTTGTTGQPFRFVRTRLAQSYKIASRVRYRRWYGVERNSPLLNVGGISSHKNSVKEKISHLLHFLATNRIEVFSSDLQGDGCEHAAKLIEKHRLSALMGYPTGIAALAEHLSQGRQLAHQPKAIFTNSETLTELMRSQIRRGFGIEPRADYVATEGSIAHECPQGGLHVDMEETLVELLPADNPDGMGEVVMTSLHSFDFPLIRYRLGDLARWSDTPCSCDRGLKTLDGLLGRSADGITTLDGKVFTAANINMRIAHFPFVERIRQYQIVQGGENSLEVRVLETPQADEETLKLFHSELSEMFPGMQIEIKLKSELPREKTGKFRPIIGLKK